MTGERESRWEIAARAFRFLTAAGSSALLMREIHPAVAELHARRSSDGTDTGSPGGGYGNDDREDDRAEGEDELPDEGFDPDALVELPGTYDAISSDVDAGGGGGDSGGDGSDGGGNGGGGGD